MLAVDTVDFLERVSVCEAVADIATLLYGEIAKLGFRGVAMSWMPEPGTRQTVAFESVSTAPDYHRHYSEQRYERYSPVVRRMQTTSMPFRRSDVVYDPQTQPMAHRVMTEARDFGIHDAWTIPIYGHGRLSGWVCGTSDRPIIPPDRLRQFHVMALWAHSHAGHLRATGAVARPRLSPREREVVSWLAAGKTADEIARILNLSPRTVEYHIANAALKLGTSNRTHTVVEAIRLKQIHI